MLEVRWPVDVFLAILLTPPLGLTVQQDVRAGFGDNDEVENLDEATKNELHPADPFPTR